MVCMIIDRLPEWQGSQLSKGGISLLHPIFGQAVRNDQGPDALRRTLQPRAHIPHIIS